MMIQFDFFYFHRNDFSEGIYSSQYSEFFVIFLKLPVMCRAQVCRVVVVLYISCSGCLRCWEALHGGLNFCCGPWFLHFFRNSLTYSYLLKAKKRQGFFDRFDVRISSIIGPSSEKQSTSPGKRKIKSLFPLDVQKYGTTFFSFPKKPTNFADLIKLPDIKVSDWFFPQFFGSVFLLS